MEPATAGLVYRDDDAVEPGEYRAMFALIGRRPIDAGDDAVVAALRVGRSLTARTADGTLVGLARLLDDGLLYASVWDVAVDPAHRRRGVARELMRRAMAIVDGRRLVALVATEMGEPLYRELGFSETSGGSVALFLRPEGGRAPAPAGEPAG